MSGHSKWSKIKRKKGSADAKRSQIFSRISKEITVAVKEGGGSDPSMNARLRLAIMNAKGQNMPKENIERAISKGEKEGGDLTEINFEGYGIGGVAVYVECLSDNNNRTVSAIRTIFNRRGGTLGTKGSLNFLFDRKGVFSIPVKKGMSIEELELELIDAGAEDIEVEDEMITLTAAIEDYGRVNKKLEDMRLVPEKAELLRIPNMYKNLPVSEAKKFLSMIDELEENDDVQNIYHNLAITDELEMAMSEE
jgi:YebC/PmpR family DNA-binding regulatory protein